jgi:peptidoglycan/LPS O-acetylase OafA/YrhL
VSTRLTYAPALDGVRGIAVISVMAFHAHLSFAKGGFAGVDIFFTLSGFLITALLLREAEEAGRISLRLFYIRRALRLVPALTALLVVMVVYPRAFSMTREQANTAVGVAALYMTNWAQGLGLVDMTNLAHTWSLAIEEQFYLVWPPVVALVVALGLRREWLILVATAGIVGAAAMRLVLWTGAGAWVRLYNGLDTRIDALLVGALAAMLYTRLPARGLAHPRALRVAVVLAALPLLAAVAYFDHVDQAFYFGGSLIVAVCTAVVLVGVLTAGGPVATLLAWAPLVWLGRISYGLYLWHYPLIAGMFDESRLARLGVPAVLFLPIHVASSLAVATASFYLLERPLLRIKRRFGSRIVETPAAAGAAPVAPPVLVRVRFTPTPDGCASCQATPLEDERAS